MEFKQPTLLCFIGLICSTALMSVGQTTRPTTKATTKQANDKNIAGSVHLWWKADPGLIFYNEVKVEKSYNWTYFCACGFTGGYFGIQQMGPREHGRVIFSVWDPPRKGDGIHANTVAKEDQVEVLYSMPGLYVGRFGNEGTGGHTHWDYDWKVGQTYKFMVVAKPQDNKTSYAAYFFVPEDKAWKHLVTLRTLSGKPLAGYYSFVEDFHGSPAEMRRGVFGNGWVRTVAGDWKPLTHATFTTTHKGDGGLIDGGVAVDGFYLQQSGDTVRHINPRDPMDRPATGYKQPELPEDLK